jgi:hypothetical protein
VPTVVEVVKLETLGGVRVPGSLRPLVDRFHYNQRVSI